LVVDTQVKVCSRETHSPSRASKIYGHNAFQITHLHTTVISITNNSQEGIAKHTNTVYKHSENENTEKRNCKQTILLMLAVWWL